MGQRRAPQGQAHVGSRMSVLAAGTAGVWPSGNITMASGEAHHTMSHIRSTRTGLGAALYPHTCTRGTKQETRGLFWELLAPARLPRSKIA